MDIRQLLFPASATMQRALSLRSARQELLARNVANANTPSYQATDISFEESMKDADANAPSMTVSDPRHLPPGGSVDYPELRLVAHPATPGLDGNTVDMEAEMGRMAENSILYGATTQITAGIFSSLLHAIREGR